MGVVILEVSEEAAALMTRFLAFGQNRVSNHLGSLAIYQSSGTV
jgi:hypothetical protein